MGRIRISFGFVSALCLLLWLEWQLGVWFLLGIICHELGHLLAMLLCRVRVSMAELRFSGAVITAQFPGCGKELICTAAGPAVSILSAVLLRKSAPVFSVVSGLLAAVNLLPIYPLDGGRILQIILLRCCSMAVSSKVMQAATYIVCGLLMLFACWLTAVRQAGLWPLFAVLVLLCRVGRESSGA